MWAGLKWAWIKNGGQQWEGLEKNKMAATVEDVMKLVSEGKLEEAGKMAREDWGHITSLDSTQRESIFASCSPEEQSLAWLAGL